MKVYIHLGLHKTASTFLQKIFFIKYAEESGYINIRKDFPEFIDYILNCNDLEFDEKKAKKLFFHKIEGLENTKIKITFSDEQFCGSPWDNAKDRKRSFDRLNELFPSAKYILVFRNQEDMTESLYLQYIKTGGSANWMKFSNHTKHPLEFSRKSYLNYGDYVEYIISKVGKQRIFCLYYEDMINNPLNFLSEMANIIDFEIDKDINKIVNRRENKSLTPCLSILFILLNKIFSSIRQPFNLLPRRSRTYIMKLIIMIFPYKNKGFLDRKELRTFCEEPKRKNHVLAKISNRDLSKMGY